MLSDKLFLSSVQSFCNSIANLSVASAVLMYELCLMAVLHSIGLEKPENFIGLMIS